MFPVTEQMHDGRILLGIRDGSYNGENAARRVRRCRIVRSVRRRKLDRVAGEKDGRRG